MAASPRCPSGGAAAAAPDACLALDALLCLPFSPLLAALGGRALRAVVRRACRPAAAYAEQVDGAVPPGGPAPPRLPRPRLLRPLEDVQWLLGLLLLCGLAVELAEGATVGGLAWPQLVAIPCRAGGVLLSLAMPFAVQSPSSRLWIALLNVLVWLLGLSSLSVRLYFELPFPTASCWLRPGLTIATMAIAACLLLCNAVAALLWARVRKAPPPLLSDPAAVEEAGQEEKDAVGSFAHDQVSLPVRYTYAWVLPLLVQAWRQPLQATDLGRPPASDSAAATYHALAARWGRQPAVCGGRGDRASLLWPLCRQHAVAIGLAYGVRQAADLLLLVLPFALKALVEAVAAPPPPPPTPVSVTLGDLLRNGWVLAGAMLLVSTLRALLSQMFFFITFRTSTNVQTALMALVYAKALCLNPETLPNSVTVGSINSHMAVDVNTVALLFQQVQYCVALPVQLLVLVGLLYRNVGWAGPASLLVTLVGLPLQSVISKLSARAQKTMMATNDGRLRLLHELLAGVRVVKFYAWEALFATRIVRQREEQLKALWARCLWATLTNAIALVTPHLMMTAAFALFAWWSAAPLTPGGAFATVALLDAARLPMLLLPAAVTACINAHVSGRRLSAFLCVPDMDRTFYAASTERRDDVAVKVCGTFGWNPPADLSSGAPPSLPFTFDVHLRPGTLAMVVGPVGGGKSTLVKAMLGEVPCSSGGVTLHGTVAYVPQQAAIFNASLRDNILFGQPHEPPRYERVLAASGLLPDLQTLAHGDTTEIGAKGINLSGGQKQRVSIARALYAASDVVLLDDPLSALDGHVGEHVFREAVVGLLTSQGKTVVMVTHQLQYLESAHVIFVVAQGTVLAQGTLAELIAAGHETHCAPVGTSSPGPQGDDGAPLQRAALGGQLLEASGSAVSSKAVPSFQDDPDPATEEAEASGSVGGTLTKEEDRVVGAVGWPVYRQYFTACGAAGVGAFVMLQTVAKGITVGGSVVLAAWSSNSTDDNPEHAAAWYLTIFSLLALAYTLTQLAASVLSAWLGIRGARALHTAMLDCVACCPVHFFDTTPLGRILNRFSNDVNNVDTALAETTCILLRMLLNLLSAALTVIAVHPLQALLLGPAAILYGFVQHFFRYTSRELQRLQNISKSPIFALLSETLGALSTVRAYHAADRFTGRVWAEIDRFAITTLMLSSSNRWLATWLDLLGCLVVFATAVFCVLAGPTLSPGLAGLALAYALTFTNYLAFFVKSITEVEMAMNSVERIAHYTRLETERPPLGLAGPPVPRRRSTVGAAELSAVSIVPAPGWPTAGAVAFTNLSAAHRPGLPAVLRGVSLAIRGGEWVGVCGRTGSGKTSLLLALFRMMHVLDGGVTLDGLDLAAVPVDELRRRIAIIPQEAVLFSGTVRSNLDPASAMDDARLWEALEVAQLRDAVVSLDQEVMENGENFSAGQRQLFCLARAFLKRARVLCLDEATASVAPAMDATIQRLLRSAFQGCTVITIAHRLTTILDYDRVVVLDAGRVVEFDAPANLLWVDSTFRRLVDAATFRAV